ncbi:MAG: hypothetical protein V4613_13445 [Bacteroidota bacterium]
MNNRVTLMETFKLLQNKETYFDEMNKAQSKQLVLNQLLIIVCFAFIYGAVMGSSHSFLQAISSGVKLVFLFVAVIVVCFPSFFIIQQVLGSKMTIRQMLTVILSGFLLMATIVISFVPIVLFFQLTGGDYHFLQLLHVSIFIFAGIFGLRVMLDALKYACETKSIYPQTGVKVFKVWIVILGFVGIQLAWNLLPFVCEKNEDFKLFRKHEGNFYTAVVYSFDQLLNGNKNEVRPLSNEYICHDTIVKVPSKDSIHP